MRGVANQEPMTPETVVRLGRAVAHRFKAPGDRRCIVIGKDTRLTGYMLETALTAGITSMGVDVALVGPLPTPGIAFITRSLRADAGVVISASHNSFEDNGIKFFSGDGFKLPDETEAEIEELIFSGRIDQIRPPASEIGKAYRVGDAGGRYIECAKSSFPKGLTLRGLKIVLDCAHGASYRVSPTVLRSTRKASCGRWWRNGPRSDLPTTETGIGSWRWTSSAGWWTATRSWRCAPWTWRRRGGFRDVRSSPRS
jgi:phosphoglucosamine mutase